MKTQHPRWQRAYCPDCIEELVALAEVGTLTDNLRRRLASLAPVEEADCATHQCPAEGCLLCGWVS